MRSNFKIKFTRLEQWEYILDNVLITGTYSASDTTPPTVDTFTPADGATGVSNTANLVITFSESVDTVADSIYIKLAADSSVFEAIAVTDTSKVSGSGTATITINPAGTFASNTEYFIQIDSTCFDDDSGNGYAGIYDDTTWNFTTELGDTTYLTWDGGGGDSNWSTAANWDPDQAPTAGDTLAFGGTTRTTNNNDLTAATEIGAIVFNTGAGAFTIGGNSITLNGSITNNDDSEQTINLDIATTAVRTVNAASGNITLGGVISGSGGGINKTGSNALTLSGANTFTGGVTLNAGTLNINNATALGDGAGTFSINGGTIDNTSGGAITLSNNNPQAWDADFAFTGANNLNLGTGAVTLGANRIVTVNGGELTVGGVISGSYSLTKAGSATLVLSGANDYTGATTISAGTLRLGAAGVIPDGALSRLMGPWTCTVTAKPSGLWQVRVWWPIPAAPEPTPSQPAAQNYRVL
jgi:autotransporter-associated beta strand protein